MPVCWEPTNLIYSVIYLDHCSILNWPLFLIHHELGLQKVGLHCFSSYLVKGYLPLPGTVTLDIHWTSLLSVTQSCLTLCDSMDNSPPGSSVHGILQARILEWVAIPSCRGPSWPKGWTQFSCTAGRFFSIWATREALCYPWYSQL